MRNSKEYNSEKNGKHTLKNVYHIHNTNCLRESQEEKKYTLLVVVWRCTWLQQ